MNSSIALMLEWTGLFVSATPLTARYEDNDADDVDDGSIDDVDYVDMIVLIMLIMLMMVVVMDCCCW